MYLNIDCLYTIALLTDYKTTLNLLCTVRLQKDFWKNKWQYLYADKTYFNNFTRQQNYLLKENIYLLTYTNTNRDELVISNMLTLKPVYDNFQSLLIYELTASTIKSFKLNVNKSYIVLKTTNYIYEQFYQDDLTINCYKAIKSAYELDIEEDYIIIDVSKLTFYLSTKCLRYAYYNKYNIKSILDILNDS